MTSLVTASLPLFWPFLGPFYSWHYTFIAVTIADCQATEDMNEPNCWHGHKCLYVKKGLSWVPVAALLMASFWRHFFLSTRAKQPLRAKQGADSQGKKFIKKFQLIQNAACNNHFWHFSGCFVKNAWAGCFMVLAPERQVNIYQHYFCAPPFDCSCGIVVPCVA